MSFPQWEYNNVTAEYHLQTQRKNKGLSVKLPANKGKTPPERMVSSTERSGSSLLSLRVMDMPMFGSTMNLTGSGENLHFAPVRLSVQAMEMERVCWAEGLGEGRVMFCMLLSTLLSICGHACVCVCFRMVCMMQPRFYFWS